MARQNRVNPFGQIIATPARGTLMGNRGCLHDDLGRIRRQAVGKRWILCLLAFKGRRRQVMAPGKYTELFFLDEATGLAAGHRPCAECQRSRYNQFVQTWAVVHGLDKRPSAQDMDSLLHRQRVNRQGSFVYSTEPLPDGVFVTPDEVHAYLRWRGHYLLWQPDGYRPAYSSTLSGQVRIMTPDATVRVLAAGYPVDVHASALV